MQRYMCVWVSCVRENLAGREICATARHNKTAKWQQQCLHCVGIYFCMHICKIVYEYTYICIYLFMPTFMCTHVHMYTHTIDMYFTYTYISIYIYSNIHMAMSLSVAQICWSQNPPPLEVPFLEYVVSGGSRKRTPIKKYDPTGVAFFKGGCLPPAFGTRTVPKRRTTQGGISCNEYI